MTSERGLTLVEIVVALMILVVGILAAFALQASALRGSRTADVAQVLSNMAESELQLQREFQRHVSSPVHGEVCRSWSHPDGFTCVVDVFPCQLSGNHISCVNGTVVEAVARQVRVTITGPGNMQYRSSAVVH